MGGRKPSVRSFPIASWLPRHLSLIGRSVDPIGFGPVPTDSGHRYRHSLNYEAFQQPDSAARLARLVVREQIDFIVVDDIHYAKQRAVENLSQRRRLVRDLCATAAGRNPEPVRALGMSATPGDQHPPGGEEPG